jgi:hypothetical protein
MIPIVNIFSKFCIGMEAYKGKTMTEIEAEENLKR